MENFEEPDHERMNSSKYQAHGFICYKIFNNLKIFKSLAIIIAKINVNQILDFFEHTNALSQPAGNEHSRPPKL